MATITLDGLTKVYGTHAAVDHINLHIKNGEFISLLGPSGCGKTTTLRMLAGFISPDDGQILVNDKVVSSRHKTIPPEKRNMSMLFQSYAIWPHKTVFENVAFGLQLRKIGKEELRRRVNQALEVVRLSKMADRYPSQLSGGQQQRVALARAVVIEPEILLMDEPLSNLDASLREEMRSEVRRLHDEIGITTVYVTHDQGEALVTSDRIVVMYDGNIQQVGTPEEIYESPSTEFVARFIGRCNILPGTLLSSGQVDVGGLLVEARNRAEGVSTGHNVVLSVRPHSIIMDGHGTSGSSANHFAARITHQVYLGEYREYTVRLDNTDLELDVIAPPHIRRNTGDQVYLTIPPETCRLVPPSSRIMAEVKETVTAMTSEK
jgi:iron(III) transport system ATP-binding protein